MVLVLFILFLRPSVTDTLKQGESRRGGEGIDEQPTPEEIAADADGCRARLRASIEAKLDGLRVSVGAESGTGVHGILTRVHGRLQVVCEGV
jgi:hypothetical protein